MPPMWHPDQFRDGSSAKYFFEGRLGFTKRDYDTPTGNVLLFIQVLWLKASAHCISVLTFNSLDFSGFHSSTD